VIGDVLGADAGEFWLSRDDIYILIKPVGCNRWRRKLDEDLARSRVTRSRSCSHSMPI